MQIASYIDHTILKPAATAIDIKKTCEEALQYEFAAVCVPPPAVRQARELLSGSPVRTATVIGFPFGYSVAEAKLAEVEQAISDGADELDAVINLIALKGGDWGYLEKEMQAITGLIHAHHRIVKVIIESGLLNEEEIVRCCALYSELGVDFVKTSTGYAEKGASVSDVRLMRRHLPAWVRIKASGGVRNYPFAMELIAAGADRLGCSASVEIVKGEAEERSGEPSRETRTGY